MVAVPPSSIGPKLYEVRGNATELRLHVRISGPVVWCTLTQIVRASRGPYDVFEQIDRWAADFPGKPRRLTRDVAQEILAEAVLQRRLPGID